MLQRVTAWYFFALARKLSKKMQQGGRLQFGVLVGQRDEGFDLQQDQVADFATGHSYHRILGTCLWPPSV